MRFKAENNQQHYVNPSPSVFSDRSKCLYPFNRLLTEKIDNKEDKYLKFANT
jgi:hypothetical protein